MVFANNPQQKNESKAAVLQVHSVVFANSGTVLLCLVDTTSQLASMRQKITKAFPGYLPTFSFNTITVITVDTSVVVGIKSSMYLTAQLYTEAIDSLVTNLKALIPKYRLSAIAAWEVAFQQVLLMQTSACHVALALQPPRFTGCAGCCC